MFTRPDDLSDSDVARALLDGWSLTPDRIEYTPLGFGSHHWSVTAARVRWFATADDLDAKRRALSEGRQSARARLLAALTVSRRLTDAGLDFVIAPIPSQSGDFLHSIGDHYQIALYPHVEGETHEWGRYPTRSERLAVLDRIAAVHAATDVASDVAVIDDFSIQSRDELERALSDSTPSWGPGPFAEDARHLVERNAGPLRSILAKYDELVGAVASRPDRRVLTHGEPHRANTITTTEGTVLIDWDTALLAPPERDLWALIDEDPEIAEYYLDCTGTVPDPEATKLYRLGWDLCEIALYVAEFRKPHRDTEDVRVAWRGLVRHLDPSRWTAI